MTFTKLGRSLTNKQFSHNKTNMFNLKCWTTMTFFFVFVFFVEFIVLDKKRFPKVQIATLLTPRTKESFVFHFSHMDKFWPQKKPNEKKKNFLNNFFFFFLHKSNLHSFFFYFSYILHSIYWGAKIIDTYFTLAYHVMVQLLEIHSFLTIISSSGTK